MAVFTKRATHYNFQITIDIKHDIGIKNQRRNNHESTSNALDLQTCYGLN